MEVVRGKFRLVDRLACEGDPEPGVVRLLERLGRRPAWLRDLRCVQRSRSDRRRAAPSHKSPERYLDRRAQSVHPNQPRGAVSRVSYLIRPSDSTLAQASVGKCPLNELESHE
jgi:hypothetical protein